MSPVFGRIIVEPEQIILALLQIFHSPFIFRTECFYELVIGLKRIPLVSAMCMSRIIWVAFFLHGLRHLVQNIRRL